jgi:hypothetical protein
MILNYINTTCLEADELANQEQYDQETHDTGVIYQAWNIVTNRSYIGKAFSYVKNGKQIKKKANKKKYSGSKSSKKKYSGEKTNKNTDNYHKLTIED